MDGRQWRRRLLRRGARAVDRSTRALGAAGQRLAERLAYRPREVVVVALLAAGLFGGLAIEAWRARHPARAARLEAEPVRATMPVQAAPRARPRSAPARCDAPTAATSRRGGGFSVAPAEPRLDWNRATPAELAQVAGISWRLAARLVAAREAFEGRAWGRSTPADSGRPPVESPTVADPRDGDTPEALSDGESP